MVDEMKKQKIVLVNPAGINLVGDKTLPLALLSIFPIVDEQHYVLLYIPLILFWYKMEIF